MTQLHSGLHYRGMPRMQVELWYLVALAAARVLHHETHLEPVAGGTYPQVGIAERSIAQSVAEGIKRS